MSVQTDANAYYRDTTLLERQALALLLRLWASVDVGDIPATWARLLPDAAAILVAAQTVAAEMADPYLTQVLDDADTRHPVDPGGMIRPLDRLLYVPAKRAESLLSQGLAGREALDRAKKLLATNVRTSVADMSRLSVAAGMGVRPHVGGYYRVLSPPSCSRCAILAGKFYRWNTGFKRHRNCDCKHIPTREKTSSLRYDARKAIAAGQVTGLSQANTRAILEFGANPSQVVNAQSGMYTAGGYQFTTTGTTRGAVAGARILAKDIDRALGLDVGSRTYTNFTFDRLKAAQYADLFRSGKTYTRLTAKGRPQQYAYRFVRTPRPTPEQILTSAGSRVEATRLLTNYGYVL